MFDFSSNFSTPRIFLQCLILLLAMTCLPASVAAHGISHPQPGNSVASFAALDSKVSTRLGVAPITYLIDLGARANTTLTYNVNFAISGRSELCVSVVGAVSTMNHCLGGSSGGSGKMSGSVQLPIAGYQVIVFWCNKDCKGSVKIDFTLSLAKTKPTLSLGSEDVEESNELVDETTEQTPGCCSGQSPSTAVVCSICCPGGKSSHCNNGWCPKGMGFKPPVCAPPSCTCG